MVSLEHAMDWVVAAIGAVVGWLITQWNKLRGEVRANEKAIGDLTTRTAVLEARFDALPEALREIKNELVGLRQDFTEEMRALHGRVDQKADR